MGSSTPSRRSRCLLQARHRLALGGDPRRLPTRIGRSSARHRSDARRDRAGIPIRPLHAMILVDSNVPMYLVGVAHPNREAARRALEEAVTAGETLCTDAEVLQE